MLPQSIVELHTSVWRELLNGTFCPGGTANLEMCPVGHYCKTPEVKQECGEKKFCMLKSNTNWLESPCTDPQSNKLCRSMDSSSGALIAFFCILRALIFGFIALGFFRNFEKGREKISAAAEVAKM